MPSHVLSTRVPPELHARVQALAMQRGKSLAATTADLLAAALKQAGVPDAALPEGPVTVAVRETLDDLTAPEAVVHRETALSLARTVDRRERGHVAAARQLLTAIRAAQSAQRDADNPMDFSMDELLGRLRL